MGPTSVGMVFQVTPSNLLLVLAVVLVFGFFGKWMFEKTRIPDTLLLILLGFLIGRLFDVEGGAFMTVMPYVGVIALITILFDGGMELRFKDLATGLPRASGLAVSGFVLSVLAVMLYGHFILDLGFMVAAMLGSIVGGTSAVVILPMLSGLALGKKAETMLGLESALTDVLCVVVTLGFAGMIATGEGSGLGLAQAITSGFTVALVAGLIAGIAWLWGLQRIRETGAEYVWTVTALFALYGIVELFGGSGPIAVLVFGLMLGNAETVTKMFHLPKRRLSPTMKRMQDELVFFVRSFFFVFLGLVFDPQFLAVTPILSSPLLKAFGLFLVLAGARAGAVWLSTLGDEKLTMHRQRFVLLMPRGLAAAVLATIPAAAPYGIVGIEAFVGYAFAILLLSNLTATFAAFVGGKKKKPRPKPVGAPEVDDRVTPT
ncbi:MAG: cation:proton antiporter [Euryarchaeota archaeon]|nr:cation:proton antiporter [Euryarchaeota archaeon]